MLMIHKRPSEARGQESKNPMCTFPGKLRTDLRTYAWRQILGGKSLRLFRQTMGYAPYVNKIAYLDTHDPELNIF